MQLVPETAYPDLVYYAPGNSRGMCRESRPFDTLEAIAAAIAADKNDFTTSIGHDHRFTLISLQSFLINIEFATCPVPA
ncbi:hypothetical protein PY650_20395 [Rhizobium calliandrae]|uniref:Uncharacterized protein n=1 Tax=Rhizobium calliandrae TaxID=1312182 RepID=A0ABT7KH95_9HYPH|nr:hypothetical protein [Rhizobium calliandrae]MDL2407980.1 hypothetical protein [Rhizobium calliandrae]